MSAGKEFSERRVEVHPKANGWCGALFAIGALYGVAYHHLAYRTWRDFIEPPELSGFGPFLLNSAEHVVFTSIRSVSGLLLVAALLLLWAGKRKSSSACAIASAIGILAFNMFQLRQVIHDYGRAFVHHLSLFDVIDVSLAVLLFVGAWRLEDSVKWSLPLTCKFRKAGVSELAPAPRQRIRRS